MLSGLVTEIADRANTGYRNQVKARVADMVAETDPSTVGVLMGQIGRTVQKDREFADRLHQVGVLSSKLAGGNVVPLYQDGVLAQGALYAPQESTDGR